MNCFGHVSILYKHGVNLALFFALMCLIKYILFKINIYICVCRAYIHICTYALIICRVIKSLCAPDN
jgi:hypothetical protein